MTHWVKGVRLLLVIFAAYVASRLIITLFAYDNQRSPSIKSSSSQVASSANSVENTLLKKENLMTNPHFRAKTRIPARNKAGPRRGKRPNVGTRKPPLKLPAVPKKKLRSKLTCPAANPPNINFGQLCQRSSRFIVYAKLNPDFPSLRFLGYNNQTANCLLPNEATCVFTNQDSQYSSADALYIHECFSYCMLPAYPQQVLIHYNLGPEVFDCNKPTGNQTLADFRISYTTNSDMTLLYLCLPAIQHAVLDALQLDPPTNRSGIAVFVSDCRADFSMWRYTYLKELMEYIQIDSYGECLHNTDIDSSRRKGNIRYRFNLKIDTVKSMGYKFLMSFENSVVQEYITEKIWHSYLAQAIPVYYGAPEVYTQAPGANTFIDAAKYTPRELAEYINKVDADESLYQSFFKFDIAKVKAVQDKYCEAGNDLACGMCRRAYDIKMARCSQP